MILSDAVWLEVDLRPRDVLIVPVGAIEQHGPHLPLRTDVFLAEQVALAAHAACPTADLAPAVSIAASGEHADFPGTLSIGTRALADTVVELVRHASAWWTAVLIVNGHGGNAEALRNASHLCASEGRAVGVTHLALPGMDAHAGRAETSMMLHLAPHLVRTEALATGPTGSVAELLPTLRGIGVRAVSPNGVLGDPRAATAAEGHFLFEALVGIAIDGVNDLLQDPNYTVGGQ